MSTNPKLHHHNNRQRQQRAREDDNVPVHVVGSSSSRNNSRRWTWTRSETAGAAISSTAATGTAGIQKITPVVEQASATSRQNRNQNHGMSVIGSRCGAGGGNHIDLHHNNNNRKSPGGGDDEDSSSISSSNNNVIDNWRRSTIDCNFIVDHDDDVDDDDHISGDIMDDIESHVNNKRSRRRDRDNKGTHSDYNKSNGNGNYDDLRENDAMTLEEYITDLFGGSTMSMSSLVATATSSIPTYLMFATTRSTETPTSTTISPQKTVGRRGREQRQEQQGRRVDMTGGVLSSSSSLPMAARTRTTRTVWIDPTTGIGKEVEEEDERDEKYLARHTTIIHRLDNSFTKRRWLSWPFTPRRQQQDDSDKDHHPRRRQQQSSMKLRPQHQQPRQPIPMTTTNDGRIQECLDVKNDDKNDDDDDVTSHNTSFENNQIIIINNKNGSTNAQDFPTNPKNNPRSLMTTTKAATKTNTILCPLWCDRDHDDDNIIVSNCICLDCKNKFPAGKMTATVLIVMLSLLFLLLAGLAGYYSGIKQHQQ